jgi:hypothetical protein
MSQTIAMFLWNYSDPTARCVLSRSGPRSDARQRLNRAIVLCDDIHLALVGSFVLHLFHPLERKQVGRQGDQDLAVQVAPMEAK